MDLAFTLPIAIACIAGAGFAVNEWSHGAMAEAMGLGHHHALAYDGGHCASVNGTLVPTGWGHMHGPATGLVGCPGGGSRGGASP